MSSELTFCFPFPTQTLVEYLYLAILKQSKILSIEYQWPSKETGNFIILHFFLKNVGWHIENKKSNNRFKSYRDN